MGTAEMKPIDPYSEWSSQTIEEIVITPILTLKWIDPRTAWFELVTFVLPWQRSTNWASEASYVCNG